MMHSTHKNWTTVLVATLLFFVAGVAQAINFGPTPTKFTTESLDGTYEVTFATCRDANMGIQVLNLSDYVLVDANGTKVPYSFVVPEQKDDYTVVFTVANANEAPAGTYTIKVPASAFCLLLQNSVVSDAFDITIDFNAGGDPGTEVDPDPEVDPGKGSDVATFNFEPLKADVTTYFKAGDAIQSNVVGVELVFDRVGVDGSGYSMSYATAGFLQLKDCAFHISAPAGMGIMKIQFVDGAPTSTIYDLDNLEGEGYADEVWKGYSQSASFQTKVLRYEVWDEDEDGYDILTGYTEEISGARTKAIYVTLDSDVEKKPDGIGVLATAPTTIVAFDLTGRKSSGKGIVLQNGIKVLR